MRPFLCLLLAAVCLPACANFIRESDAVILDVVDGTDKISLEEERVEGAVAKMRVHFVCTKRLFSVTNIYETPYDGSAELYEVPVGLITLVPTALWYVGATVISGASAEKETVTSPICWSAAGLNPFLNVENGMFTERYIIRLKPGSKRPQEGSHEEPFDAAVEPDQGELKVAWAGAEPVTVKVPQEVLISLNLVEIARAMPKADVQRVDITLTFRWDSQRDSHVLPPPPLTKTVNLYIDAPLAERLYAARDASRQLIEGTTLVERDEAFKALSTAGFSKEAAMLRDKLPPLATASP